MKTFLAVLVSAALLQQSNLQYNPVATTTHPVVTPTTEIRIPETSVHCSFNALVTIGMENHIPMGIIVGDTPNTEICGTSLNLKQKTMTMAELIAAIKAALPHYHVDLQNGVLEISPAKLSKGTAQLLNMQLVHFHSAPEPHTEQGHTLWWAIYGVIAPGAGYAASYLGSLSTETVPGIDASNQNVKTILDMIVDKGNGGVWILYSSKIKRLSPEIETPFDIYGYASDNSVLLEHLTCLK
jgi:hypothetical protein